MEYERLIVERQDNVAVVRLNRPEKHNALNAKISYELIEALDRLEGDGGVHVIVLTGAGDKAFCAGADMAEATRGDGPSASRGEAPAPPAEAALRVLRTRKPIIAAVNGYAYGGGALVAINCDIRIASDNAKFRFVGASYGLVVGGSQLPKVVGGPMAKELLFTSRTVDAEEALRIGLVNHVVPQDELETAVMSMAAEIAANSQAAVLASKEVIDLATGSREAAVREVQANLELRGSPEHRERFGEAARRVTREK